MNYWALPGIKITLIGAICQAFGVTEKELKGKSKGRYVASARHAYFYVAYNTSNPKLSGYEKIGRSLNRDHCTALYGVRKTKDLLPIYKDLQEKVALVTTMVNMKIRAKQKQGEHLVSENGTKKGGLKSPTAHLTSQN